MEKNREELVSAIYSAILSPDNFDETLANFDNLIFGSEGISPADKVLPEQVINQHKIIQNIPGLDSHLIKHIQLAYQLQQKVGRHKVEKQKVMMLLDAAPNPAYLFDGSENIITLNAHAQNKVSPSAKTLEACCSNPHFLDTIRKFMISENEQKLLVVSDNVSKTQSAGTCILIKKIENYSDDGTGNLFLYTEINLGIDSANIKLFGSAYSLTEAEAAITLQLASGNTISEIADLRGATIPTLRSQIKSIKKKTRTRDIPTLVRLVCGFSAGILTSSQINPDIEQITHAPSPQKLLKKIILRDGRQMSYLEQGDMSGAPVILIHNMPYGAELPQKAIQAADRLKLRILAPYRPGFGNSDLNKHAHGDDLLDAVAADINEFMGQLNIPKATIVGNVIGTLYAMRFAKLFPAKVVKLIAISRAPVWRDEWMATTPRRQRFIVRITKYLPQLLPLITRATVMYLDKGNSKKLIYSLVHDSKADLAALDSNPEIVELMTQGNEDGLKQGAEAFDRDCFLSIRDFSQEASTLEHPFHILHGEKDAIVDVMQSKVFAAEIPGTKLEIVKGAGHLLFYSHWEYVIKAIKNNTLSKKL